MKDAYALLAVRWAVATVAVLIILKCLAYWSTGATSMLGSLVDTLGDAGLSLLALGSVWVAQKPADKNHRHGHGKIEGIFALFQAAFLGGAAVFLAFESLRQLYTPADIQQHEIGLAVSGITIVLTLLLVQVQRYAMRYTSSLAVAADHAHYLSDLFLNTSVIIALLLDWYGAPAWLDGIAGALIALYMGAAGYNVGTKAADMLLDKEISATERLKIEALVKRHPQVQGMHDLRTRWCGKLIYISFDVELPGQLSLVAAHDIIRELEQTLLAEFPQADIIIHPDPEGDTADTRHRVPGIHH
mgnify:CR=1 FL=1